MFNFETVVNLAMEHLTEDKILVMFPESRHYERIETLEHNQDLDDEAPVDLIESMLKEVDPELLAPQTPRPELTAPVSSHDNKDLTQVFDVQLDSLGEALERLRYYLHEIEQFLPEKSRRKR